MFFYGQRSVEATWTNPSPWSITPRQTVIFEIVCFEKTVSSGATTNIPSKAMLVWVTQTNTFRNCC